MSSTRPELRRRWIRRTVIGVSLTAIVVVGASAVFVVNAHRNARVSTVGTLDFEQPLRIPPLLDPGPDADGVVRFDLGIQSGTTEFRPGVHTPTWGVNGGHLGPTLRANRGDRVEMAVHNGLGEITTMHWHGMHLPAAMDGGPHQPIVINETWRPTWTVDQPAATLWYHPHPHGRTAEHVARGVAGMFIVDDTDGADLDLPDRYGVDDIPLIVQDRSFAADGSFRDRTNLMSSLGPLGDTILVNGTLDPHLDVEHELVRLRVLNASNARFFTFEFADRRTFDLVATDGGLLPGPEQLRQVPLSPGERAEIVVRLVPGERVVLRSVPAPLGDGSWMDRFHGADDHFDIVQLRASDRLVADRSMPDRLAAVEPIDSTAAVDHRELRLSGHRINGLEMDMERIDATARAGSVEVWTVRNDTGTPHNFHVHDVQFQVLDVDGRAPPPHLRGWHDTVPTPPGTVTRLVIRFGRHADPDTPYMYHCHVLLHEDRGMMGQFVVID